MHYNDEGELKAKYAAFMDQVEDQRLGRRILAARQPATPIYQPLLAGLGERLIAWGWRLRARYGALES
jgi:hypothetical protein